MKPKQINKSYLNVKNGLQILKFQAGDSFQIPQTSNLYLANICGLPQKNYNITINNKY